MPTSSSHSEFDTIPKAANYLRGQKEISFEALDAIMRLHVLKLPDFSGLRHNFEHREWSHLSGQLLAFSKMRADNLVTLTLGDADREALRHEAELIKLLHELAGVAGSMIRHNPSIGQ
jgi:hypothetical protein